MTYIVHNIYIVGTIFDYRRIEVYSLVLCGFWCCVGIDGCYVDIDII